MPTTFMQSPRFVYTSESVTEGHPDKLCDQVSDAILDEMLRLDPRARVACETATTTGLVVVLGEVTVNGYVPIEDVVRRTVQEIGYTDSAYGFDFRTCGVMVALHGQSPDIAQGVDKALEVRSERITEDEVATIGAGDQGMMVGFACDETREYMPLSIALAHNITRQLAKLRKDCTIPWLRPDGKS